MEQMLSEKRGELFRTISTATRLRMENDGAIKIYKDALDKMRRNPSGGAARPVPCRLTGGREMEPKGEHARLQVSESLEDASDDFLLSSQH